jgi:rSAM/selenodomain-associated transferase 2
MAVRLSIVMPALNESARIAESLQALAPLRRRGVEVIVVDGGSTDGTAALAEPWADRVLSSPRGRARQMNAGAAQARADALLFLHADTALPDQALHAIEAALVDPHTQWGRFDVRIDGRPRLLRLVAWLMNLRSRRSGIATGDQAIFVRRSAFQRVGGFPDQPLMDDIELSRRLRRWSPPACLRMRVTTSGRRWEQRGVWRTIALLWRLRWMYARGASAERLAALYRRGTAGRPQGGSLPLGGTRAQRARGHDERLRDHRVRQGAGRGPGEDALDPGVGCRRCCTAGRALARRRTRSRGASEHRAGRAVRDAAPHASGVHRSGPAAVADRQRAGRRRPRRSHGARIRSRAGHA